jgi:outer membrane biosynthesis protein TonB
VAGVALSAGLVWGLSKLGSDPPTAKRQVARIALLPDTPPPPPPPPPERAPEPPKEQPRTVEEAPKPDDAPKPGDEPLKMEGAAGDGPSAFAAGTVRQEYSGGPTAGGTAATAARATDRAQERLYASSARALLRDAIERHLESEATQATATFSLWVDGDGSIRRVDLVPTGNATLDAQLRAALDETARSLRLPPPPQALAGGEPMRFRLTVRPLG